MSTGMYEGAIQDLIDALGRLPGIGPKSAQRIAFHILQSDSEIAANLVEAVRTVKERVKLRPGISATTNSTLSTPTTPRLGTSVVKG